MAEESKTVSFKLTPLYRTQLEQTAKSKKSNLSDVVRQIVIYHLEGGPDQELADSIAELRKELGLLRGELKRRDSLDALREDLWGVLGTILLNVGDWDEDQVRKVIESHRKGGKKT